MENMIKNYNFTNEELTKKYENTKFNGKNIVASSANLVNSEIENCDIGENVEIINSVLRDCKIEKNSKIGTYNNKKIGLQYFGTDGIRGVFNEDLSEDLIKNVAKSLCFNGNIKIVVGMDTRPSGKLIYNIFINECIKYGAIIYDIGVASTPAVSFYTIFQKADYGVVITASHNPVIYNGIKVLNALGEKLQDNKELILEKLFEQPLQYAEIPGKIKKVSLNKYLSFIENIDSCKFDDIKIVLDCANGAVSSYASKIFENLHCEVIAINTNGIVNEKCGALYPQVLVNEVLNKKASLGFTFDGDADRILVVNNKGQIFDGDEILYLLTWYYKISNQLKSNKVVGTILTNTGIENKLKALGVELIRVDVGDKYIAQKILEENLELGAEQSGHITNKKFVISGDGILIARLILSIYLKNKHIFLNVKENIYMQAIKNIKLNNKINNSFFESSEYKTLINFYKNKLKNNGRIIIRLSGTEPKIRIMVETKDKITSNIFATDIKKKLTNLIKLKSNIYLEK